jgi:hypothetical protein
LFQNILFILKTENIQEICEEGQLLSHKEKLQKDKLDNSDYNAVRVEMDSKTNYTKPLQLLHGNMKSRNSLNSSVMDEIQSKLTDYTRNSKNEKL